jgi:hypothetical protein
MEGADLAGARMEGAVLWEARMEGADLRGAWMGGANLRGADLRGARGLTQEQLANVIGDESTLLPDDPPLHVWTCLTDPPDRADLFLRTRRLPGRLFFRQDHDARAALRAQWLCGPDNPRRETGTPLALDAPRPPGHPLDEQD